MWWSIIGVLKLTKSELGLLELLSKHERLGMTDIGVELGLSPPRVSQLVSSLKEQNLVNDSKRGFMKHVSLSEAKHATLFRRLTIEYEHMNLILLLSGTNLEVLSAISCLHLINRKEIHEKTLVSESSIAKSLKNLRQIGVVQKEPTYYIPARFETLEEFVAEFRHDMNRHIAQRFSTDSLITWECNHEFIVECKEEKDEKDFLPTGISAFWRYGVQLFVTKWHYLYSPFTTKINLEDAILHSILENTATNIAPTLIVWKKNEEKLDLGYLKTEGEKYGVLNKIEHMINYFRNEGEQRASGFPTWPEFMDKAKEYESL